MNEEKWKPIKNFENNYLVSNSGKIFNIKTNKFLKGNITRSGFVQVRLKDKYYYIHNLVANAFLKNDNNFNKVSHKDENKCNNNVDNLFWTNESEIRKKLYDENKINISYGKNSKKKIILQLNPENNKVIKKFNSIKECIEYFNTDSKAIYNIIRKKQKTINGKIIILREIKKKKEIDSLKNEEWKAVFNSIEISNLGRIRNKKSKEIIIPNEDNNGYLIIRINHKNYLIHKLIAKAFIPNPNNYNTVDHKDNNKKNNSVNNLQWLKNEDNVKKSFKDNLHKNTKSKIIEYEPSNNYKIINLFNNSIEVSKYYKINKRIVQRACRKKIESYKNHFFIYYKPDCKLIGKNKNKKIFLSKCKLKKLIRKNKFAKNVIEILKSIQLNKSFKGYKWNYIF